MIIQNNNFCFLDNTNQKNTRGEVFRTEIYNISKGHTFIFNEEKNDIIKKQVIKQLGEKSNLWKK